MWTRPNPTSGHPVYRQLIDQVKRDLQIGALRAGDTLPSISHLATALVVSPAVVERAYRALHGEGVIDLCQDAGVLRSATGARSAAPFDQQAALSRELDAARDVQRRLLPQQALSIAGVEYAGFCRPARAVGGDYYDFIALSESTLAIAVGDVCGKGIPAALLMATLRAFLHGQTRYRIHRPADIVRTLNQLVCESFADNRFATFFYGELDARTRILRYVNAGHPPPFLCAVRESCLTLSRLGCGGPVLGLIPDATFAEGVLKLERGDLLVAFSDGVTEATGATGDEWGEETLAVRICEQQHSPPSELVERITRDVDRFVGDAAQYDDMTLVAVRASR